MGLNLNPPFCWRVCWFVGVVGCFRAAGVGWLLVCWGGFGGNAGVLGVWLVGLGWLGWFGRGCFKVGCSPAWGGRGQQSWGKAAEVVEDGLVGAGPGPSGGEAEQEAASVVDNAAGDAVEADSGRCVRR